MRPPRRLVVVGANGVGRRLLACLTVLVLAAGCAGSASPTTTPSSTPGPTAATAATPASMPVTASPTVAIQPQTIHVLENPAGWAEVKVGSLSGCTDTTCLGDYLVGRSSMIDAATRKEVGSLVTECFVVDAGSGRYHCPATTIALTGQGQIVFTENVLLGPHICPTCSFAPEADPAAGGYTVIGGSGEFFGATVDVTSPADSTWKYGDFVITISRESGR